MTRPKHMMAESAISLKEALFKDKIIKCFTAVLKRRDDEQGAHKITRAKSFMEPLEHYC